MNDMEKLQELSKQLQSVVLQKQQFQLQLNEINYALSELNNFDGKEVFSLAGSVMIKKDKEEVVKDLNDKKERFQLHLNSLIKKEEKLKKELKEVYDKIKDNYEKKQ